MADGDNPSITTKLNKLNENLKHLSTEELYALIKELEILKNNVVSILLERKLTIVEIFSLILICPAQRGVLWKRLLKESVEKSGE